MIKPPRLSATLLLILLTALALALRLWRLDFQSLWWDEGVSIYLAGAGARAMTLAKDFAVDLHPPGYHLLLGAWRELFGTSVFALRLLSALAGAVTVPLTALVARRIASVERRDLVGLIAAALATLSPIDGVYSQEIRMYAFLPLLGLLALYATLRLADTGRKSDWAFWVLANALGWYVYYYFAFWTLALTLGVLSRRHWRAALVAGSGLILLYLPWLLLMRQSLGRWSTAVPVETEVHLTAAQYLLEVWRALTLGFTPPPHQAMLLAGWGLLILLGILRLGARDARSLAIIILVGLVPVACAGAILLYRPFFYPRFILFVAVPIWLLTAVGAGEVVPFSRRTRLRWAGTLAAVGLTLPLLAGSGWTWYRERMTPRTAFSTSDYRVTFATVAALARPGDLVLGDYPWQVGYVDAYLGARGLRGQYLRPKADPEAVSSLAASRSRLWVYEYAPSRRFEGNGFETILAARLPTLAVDQFGDTRLRLFGEGDPAPPPPTGPTFGGVIALEASSLASPTILHPGDKVSLILRWRAIAVPKESYTVFVHLLGPDRKLYGQQDSPPLAGAFPTNQWVAGSFCIDRLTLTLAPEAPPGRYEVEIGLYRPADGQRLAVGPVPQPDNRIVVTELTVVK